MNLGFDSLFNRFFSCAQLAKFQINGGHGLLQSNSPVVDFSDSSLDKLITFGFKTLNRIVSNSICASANLSRIRLLFRYVSHRAWIPDSFRTDRPSWRIYETRNIVVTFHQLLVSTLFVKHFRISVRLLAHPKRVLPLLLGKIGKIPGEVLPVRLALLLGWLLLATSDFPQHFGDATSLDIR